ncbi:MAG: hypothetical protein IPM24_10155 [Bryobacterales bacterium]|nr:hypothetical protein [Bryobacterales bacterium]
MPLLAILLGLALMVPCSAATPQDEARAREILQRVSAEADRFWRAARDVFARETLVQRARKPPPRFRRRGAGNQTGNDSGQYISREIVSEYTFGVLAESPGSLYEFRQVLAVDGRPTVSAETARQTLAIGMRSGDDRVKRAMLDRFRQQGLPGGATDFGQMILMFTGAQLGRLEFAIGEEAWAGPDRALVLAYREKPGHESFTIFQGRHAMRQPLQGTLWVRRQDSVPLRITMISRHQEDERLRVHEATVDYAPSAFGLVLPVSVVHRDTADGILLMENRFVYEEYRKFTADSEVKFDVQ